MLRRLQQMHEPYTADVPDSAGGQGEVIAYAPLSLVPWAVVIRQSDREVFAPVYEGRRRLLQWGPLMLVLGLLFTWGAAESVRRPLALLTRAAERIAAGDLGEPIPALPSDEIGRLGAAFEAMRAQLSASIDDITRSNQQLEARVAARTRELQDAHRELQLKDEFRGKLLRKVITAQEEERKRLARELHDETCQKLAALGIRLDTALGSGSPQELRERLGDARALATQTLDDVHRVISTSGPRSWTISGCSRRSAGMRSGSWSRAVLRCVTTSPISTCASLPEIETGVVPIRPGGRQQHRTPLRGRECPHRNRPRRQRPADRHRRQRRRLRRRRGDQHR